jgi:hypothetical protein
MQLVVLACIFVGEALVVFSEVWSAKLYSALGYSLPHSVLISLAPGVAGVLLLALGYALGIKVHQNIWAVSAISLGTYLIVEPVLNVLFVGQMPALGSGIGFVLGILGILAVTFL